jgi:hypothetical protein
VDPNLIALADPDPDPKIFALAELDPEENGMMHILIFFLHPFLFPPHCSANTIHVLVAAMFLTVTCLSMLLNLFWFSCIIVNFIQVENEKTETTPFLGNNAALNSKQANIWTKFLFGKLY